MKMSEEISSSDNSTNSTIVTTQAIIEVDNVITKRKDNNIEVQPTHEMAMHSNPMLSTTTITTVVKEDIDKQINESVSSPQLVLAGSAGPSTSAIQCLKNMNEIVAQPSGSKQKIRSDSVEGGERNCWICFATDEDNSLAAWVQPCKCRGSTKWVHQSCLYRWVDEKQKGNALRAVSCQQCQTEYIIVFPHMGRVANVLEAFDNLIKRVSPFLAAGVFVGSLYWTAVTYGAVTFLQIVGHKKGLALMENGDPLILLIGLPAIPVALVLGRMIRWEDAVIRLIRNRRSVARKFPLMSFIIPYSDEDEEHQSAQNPITPTLSDPVSATRIFCGALLLPTISSIVGRLLFESIENTLHRTLLGGLTFITMKGILKIYLKQQQYTRRKKRRIVDYTEDNIRVYGGGGGGSGGGNGGARNSATRSSHNAHNNNSGNGNGNNNRAHINATGNVSGSGSGDGYANGNRNSPAIDVVLQIPLQTNQQQQQQQMYTERSGRRHSIQQHVLRSNSLRDSLV